MCVSLGPQKQFSSPLIKIAFRVKDSFYKDAFQGEATNTEINFEQNQSQGHLGVIQPNEIISKITDVLSNF